MLRAQLRVLSRTGEVQRQQRVTTRPKIRPCPHRPGRTTAAGPDYHGCGPAQAHSQQADLAAWHGIERQSLSTGLLAYVTRRYGYGGARRRGARGSGDSVTEAQVTESLVFGGVAEWRVAAPRLGATRPTVRFLHTPLSPTPSFLANCFHLSSFLLFVSHSASGVKRSGHTSAHAGLSPGKM
jgi:hypothetical protein